MRYVKFDNHVMIAFHIKEITLDQLNKIKDAYECELAIEGDYAYLLVANPIQIDWKKFGIRTNKFNKKKVLFNYETGDEYECEE